MNDDELDQRRESLESWAPTLSRLVPLGVGSFVILWQTVFENLDRPYLIGGAVTLMVGGGIGMFLDLARRGP